jgi:hypothetical protein
MMATIECGLLVLSDAVFISPGIPSHVVSLCVMAVSVVPLLFQFHGTD